MNTTRKEEIVREDKKWGKKFILILIASGILGGVLGATTLRLQGIDAETLLWLSTHFVPGLSLVLLWLCILVSLLVGNHCIRQAKALAAEDSEERYALVERKLGTALTCAALEQVTTFTFYTISYSSFQLMAPDMADETMLFVAVTVLGALAGLIFSMISIMQMQRRAVNLLKELNPEKNGSIYQMNFQKVWLASCDEAERLQIYQASYTAYRVGTYTCLGCWVVTFFGIVLGWLNWGAALLVGIIWGAMQVAYCVAARKGTSSGALLL